MGNEEQFIKREIPTGTGRESEPKETLPAIEVDNEVIWVNPDFPKLPFDIKEGEPTKLGIFLTPKPKEGEKTFDLKIAEKHKRSGLIGRAVFKDKQGRFYRDIDLKGVGYILNFGGKEMRSSPVEKCSDRRESYGILNLARARHARDMAEKFLKARIRTERYLALIKLKEIIDAQGNKISIEEAVSREIISSEIEPGIALRALGTKFRVDDIGEGKNILEKLEDTRKLVAQELGKKEQDFSWEKYLKWFAETAGKNLGLMHKNKWAHKYLSGHNLTLDCRIIDLDSAKDISELEKEEREVLMRADWRVLAGTIQSFLKATRKAVLDSHLSVKFLKNFFRSYRKSLPLKLKHIVRDDLYEYDYNS